MFCSKCGKEIFDEAIFCSSCGCATANYQPIAKNNNSTYSQDYIVLKEFEEKVKSIYITGIIALVLFLGIGLIFSFAAWIKAKNLSVPHITTTNPNEVAMFESSKRKLKSALSFSYAPMYVLLMVLAPALLYTGMYGAAILIFLVYIAILFFLYSCIKHLNKDLLEVKK